MLIELRGWTQKYVALNQTLEKRVKTSQNLLAKRKGLIPKPMIIIYSHVVYHMLLLA